MKQQIELNRDQLSNSRLFIWLAYFSIIISIILSSSYTVKAQYNPFTKITDDIYPQYNPAIDGDYVVYESWRGGSGSDIYLYDIVSGAETKITSGISGMSSHPDISGDRIVWQDNRNGGWEIYTYLISRPDIGDYPLFDFEGEQSSPAIHGNTIVWVDHRGDEFSSNIFMYDLSTGVATQITDDDDNQQHTPDIYWPDIVYEDRRTGNSDIYLYNINTQEETQLTEDPADQLNPSIHGRRVVWEDMRDGNWNLYMHHTTYGPGSVYYNYDWEIYTGDGFREMSQYNDINPAVYEDYIVFQSYRNGSWDIYLYSFINDTFGSTSIIITEAKDQINPAIYDNRIVWQDERDWDGTSAYEADIWLWERPPGADLGVIISDYPDTVLTNSIVHYTILVKNFGDQEATDVVFTQTLPEHVDFVHASGTRGNTFSLDERILTCEIGTLAVNETDSITVIVKTIQDGSLTTTCQVTATEEDPVSENNSETVVTIVKWASSDIFDYDPIASLSIETDSLGYAQISYVRLSLGSWYYGDLVYSSNKTGRWVSNTLIESDEVENNSIAVDSKGFVHIIYGDGDFRDKSLMYITNNSGIWSTPLEIKKHVGSCASVHLNLDSEDNLHISYMKTAFNWDSLFYLKNTSGFWETKLISELTYCKSSFELDKNDHAHFLYISSNEYGDPSSFKPTYVSNSPDGIWKEPSYVEENYSGGSSESFVIDMSVDNEAVPHVIYVGAINYPENELEGLKYAYLSENQWHIEIIENVDFSYSTAAIVTDINNYPHILYCNYVVWGNVDLIYSNHINGFWDTHFLETGGDYFGHLDMCADVMGNIHIVCQTYDGELIYGKYYFINLNQPYPKIHINPDDISFEPVLVDSASVSQKITIRNTGEKQLTIYDVFISEDDSIHFTITNNTSGSLEPSDTCSVDILFNPQTIGYKYAKLRIISNDPDNPNSWIALEGIGQEPTHISYPVENFISFYPNPARDFIVFQFNNNMPENEYTLRINSLSGKIMKEKIIHIDNNKQSYQIYINNLPCGIYIVSLSGENVFYHFKFIKAR